MFGARGSKILITKRDNKLVSEIADMTLLYDLEGLSEENSLSLFKKVAFKEGEEPNNPNLIKLGKEIVQKCKGFPLMIRSIGRSLYWETSEEKWMSIKDKLQPANNVISNLKLSYDHLPTSYLKQCFVYCSLFPKDFSISANEIIRLSIALGFVPSSDSSKSMEDLVNDYFMELCWRSLLQSSVLESEVDSFTYKMHDLMHDLAQTVASDDCKYKDYDAIDEKTRHISIQYNSESERNLPASIFKAKGLRTFFLHPNDGFPWIEMDTSTLNELFSNCVRLRVLKLNRSGIKEVPKSIKKLRQLRYLDLSMNGELRFLPNSITELQNLQTLDLHGCYRLKELLRDIKNLVNLRHLDLQNLDLDGTLRLKHMPKGMGKLTSLQTLNLFVVGNKDDMHACKLSELKELNHLKGELVIQGLKELNTTPSESTLARLKDKKYLRRLILNWGWGWEREDDEVDDEVDDERIWEGLEPHPNVESLGIRSYMGERLSNWVSSLSKLIEIDIFGCKRLQHLPQFDHLPLLKCLKLWDLDALEFIDIKDSVSSSVFFPSLQYLRLGLMPNLKGWWEREPRSLPSFPPLRQIEIFGCPKLVSMPLHSDLISVELIYMRLKTLKFPIASILCQTDPSSTITFSPSALEKLTLQGIEDLEFLPNRLWQHLNNLESLRIVDCEYLKGCVSENEEIESLSELKDGKLKDLELRSLPKLESLPIGPQHSATLQSLSIHNCCNLRHLPEWIGSLVSLLRLEIYRCPNLKSVPEGMRQLQSLRILFIRGCPELEERCKEGGEDWPKIAHVPSVYLG